MPPAHTTKAIDPCSGDPPSRRHAWLFVLVGVVGVAFWFFWHAHRRRTNIQPKCAGLLLLEDDDDARRNPRQRIRGAPTVMIAEVSPLVDPEPLPVREPLSARSLRLEDENPDGTTTIAIRVWTAEPNAVYHPTRPGFIDLGRAQPVTEIELFKPEGAEWMNACTVVFLGVDGETVVWKERIDRFYGVARVNMTVAAAFRPLVWDANRPVLASVDGYHDRWFPFGANHPVLALRSALGLAARLGTIGVDRLSLEVPSTWKLSGGGALFLVVRVPRVARPTVLIGAEPHIALGYDAEGNLAYYGRGAFSGPIGAVIPVEQPIVIGIRMDSTSDHPFTVVHPDGHLFRVLCGPMPSVVRITLWGDAKPDARRRLPVHEMCVFRTSLSDGQMRTVHRALLARWASV